MKFAKMSAALAACALAVTLVACGGTSTSSSYAQYTLGEVSGVKVEAENGTKDQETVTEGGLVVKENDTIVISPDVEKGSFHLTITSDDGGKVIFDDDVEGRVLFTQAAEPGTYTVTTYGNNVTGSLVVAANNQDELAAQNEALQDVLDEATAEEAKPAN